MLGSEGMFGVITEVTLRIRPVPEVRRYGSIVFPDFRTGVNFMREMAKQVRAVLCMSRCMVVAKSSHTEAIQPQKLLLSIQILWYSVYKESLHMNDNQQLQ